MSSPSAVTTERLDLRPVDPVADLEALGRLFADPEGWWYDPAGRHTDLKTSRGWLERAARRWHSDGLSYWTVRLREGGDETPRSAPDQRAVWHSCCWSASRAHYIL
jgi:RimJ/RimL family protein N-acetyltransferase